MLSKPVASLWHVGKMYSLMPYIHYVLCCVRPPTVAHMSSFEVCQVILGRGICAFLAHDTWTSAAQASCPYPLVDEVELL